MNDAGLDVGLTKASITLDFTFALQCMSGAEAILQTLDLIALDSTEGRLCVAVITLLNFVVPQSLTQWFLFTRPHITSNVTVCLNRLHSLTGMTKA